ncbi:hypothetical protein [Streptomyces sp. NPDC057623]|uniref:hypothetical protein n=1 Tax=Streptomyces sp. NPDC057623 TaxID=3346187 RepID=UPI00367EC857
MAAMGGPELEDVRKAFSMAVVNIADQDWRIMAAEVSSRDGSAAAWSAGPGASQPRRYCSARGPC